MITAACKTALKRHFTHCYKYVKTKFIPMKKLAKRIYDFIDKYAGIKPDWCEIEGIDEKYTSSDAYEMLACADMLNNEQKPKKCFSEWGSGGYKPYSSTEGKMEHDYLLAEIYKIINS